MFMPLELWTSVCFYWMPCSIVSNNLLPTNCNWFGFPDRHPYGRSTWIEPAPNHTCLASTKFIFQSLQNEINYAFVLWLIVPHSSESQVTSFLPTCPPSQPSFTSFAWIQLAWANKLKSSAFLVIPKSRFRVVDFAKPNRFTSECTEMRLRTRRNADDSNGMTRSEIAFQI